MFNLVKVLNNLRICLDELSIVNSIHFVNLKKIKKECKNYENSSNLC